MVERFNRRISSEVLGITIYSHRDLEQLLRGFNAAYNARRQRVLDGKAPNQVVAERLKARRQFVNTKTHGRAGPDDIVKACLIAEAAKEVSQPDNLETGVSHNQQRLHKVKYFQELLATNPDVPDSLRPLLKLSRET